MNAHPVVFKVRALKACSLAFFFLIASVLAACSLSVSVSQSPELTPKLENQSQAGSHPPVILRLVERQEVKNGFLYQYGDIYFKDPDGDAAAVTYRKVLSSLSYPIQLTDDPIQASVEQQKRQALFTIGGRCYQKMELVFESRIRDRDGNLSEPVTFRMSCTTPPLLDIRSILHSMLSIAFAIAMVLLLGFWLLFHKSPVERLLALRSTFLLFCLLLVLTFGQKILHEGGHALYLVIRRVPISFYVHPFTFPGYARPVIDSSTWFNILGSLTALLLSLLISLPFWKRRSLTLLPLVMLFPYIAIYDGINILGLAGDFWNLVQTNGLSPVPFYLLGVLMLVVGITLLFALLPLLGLDPQDKSSLFVLPAAIFLVSTLSILVACIVVPGSPIDREYFLGQEIVTLANALLPVQAIAWMLLAVLYVTLYSRMVPRLPIGLRTDTVQLAWKDMRLPALLASISVILGWITIL